MLLAIAGFLMSVVAILAAIFQLLVDDLNKHKYLKWTTVGTLFALALYAIVGSVVYLYAMQAPSPQQTPLPAQTPQPSTRAPIAVDSTKDWQDTGIYLMKGDAVSIVVVGGKWTIYRLPLDAKLKQQLGDDMVDAPIWIYVRGENAGEGEPTRFCQGADCPVPGGNFGALVARIGRGEPFQIGNAKTFTATAEGDLLLRINDGYREGTVNLEDNSGVLAVDVKVFK